MRVITLSGTSARRIAELGRSALILAVLAVLPTLAACASTGGAHPAASPSSTALTDAQLNVLVGELVKCIRSNGAPGMPDIKVQNGKLVTPDESSFDEATKQNFDAAMAACKSVKDRMPASLFGDADQAPAVTAGDLVKLRRFAKCMRDNGVPAWPDPKPDGSFPLTGTPLEGDKTPEMTAALSACRQYWGEGIKVS